MNDPVTNDERLVMSLCLRDGDVVVDVGAHHGMWSEAVLTQAKVELHAFEASPDAFGVLKRNLNGKAILNQCAVTCLNEDLVFHVYRDDPRLSSLYRRISVEERLLQSGYDVVTVPGITLDSYWGTRREQIRLLKLDVEGAEYDVLRGARRLLREGKIDFLQFEYGETYLDAGITLRNIWALLRRYSYHVFRMHRGRFTELKKITRKQENYQYANLLAVHERLVPSFTGTKHGIAIDFARMASFGIRPTGVLHVGAHKGAEITTYLREGLETIVFVEANPDLSESLRRRFRDDKSVKVIEAAAADREGEDDFHITSMDQSSSLLKLKEHACLYPAIKVEKTIRVRTARLDDLLAEAGINPEKIDLLVMDIQGAELMALKGAQKILAEVQAIQIEVNFKELYAGCPLIADLDEYLGQFDFIRIRTMTPYNEAWGDALYVKRPTVTCSAIGRRGRFANHIFQYLFIQTYAEEHAFQAVNPIWAGDNIFNVRPGLSNIPRHPFSMEEKGYTLSDSNIPNDPKVRPLTDFNGFFQYHTKYYRPYKSMILDHLSFKKEYAARAAEVEDLFSHQTGPVAAMHLRRGDYGKDIFFIAPEKWYADWAKELLRHQPDTVFYLASDELEKVISAFEGLPILTERDLPSIDLSHDFFTDFAALTLANHLAISNSSFSFAASMLNQRAETFVRPSLSNRGLIPYDPWNAPVLLREKRAEDVGDEFVSEETRQKLKYRLRKFLRNLA